MSGSRIYGAYALCVVSLIALAVLSVNIGVAQFDLRHLFTNPADLELLLLSRGPRTLAALLTGASLAVSGVIMQLLVRNKFVEPGTTGATEAAMIGLLVVTLLAPGWPIFAKMLAACITSLIGILGFLALSRVLPPTQPLLVPLVGLIYSGVLGAGATFVAFQTDLLQYLGTWLNGGFSGVLAGRYELLWIAGGVTVAAYFAADRFTVAGLGPTTSRALGLPYRQVMAIGVTVIAIVTSLVVVTVGLLPFIGLVVPNIVSRLMGDNLRRSLPVVAAMGAGLVLFCDILGRVIRYPYEIPAGTVFGILGGVIFLWLLLGRRRNA